MTTFYLIRHGETEYNKTGRFQGQLDVPLNDDGRSQAATIAARMAPIPLDAIYSSDLSRAAETARIVAGGRPVTFEPRLREVNVGRFMGMDKTACVAQYPEYWTAVAANPDTEPFPDGESAATLQARAMAALEAIQARHPQDRVAVITHGGVLKVIVAAILEMPLGFRDKIVLDNCSLTIVEWSERGRRLKSLNDLGHLVAPPSEVRAEL